MARLPFNILITLLGLLSCYILLQIALIFKGKTAILLLTATLLYGIYYYGLFERYLEYHKQRKIDDLINKTRDSFLTIAERIALDLYKGVTKDTLWHTFKTVIKQERDTFNNIYLRAERIAKPQFLDESYHLKQRFIPVAFFISYLIAAVTLAILFLDRQILYMLIVFAFVMAIQKLEVKIWLRNGYPNPFPAPFIKTLHNRGKNSHFRSFIALYLLNKVRIKNRLPALNGETFSVIFSNNYISHTHPLRNEDDLVISHNNVILYNYSADPREPLQVRKYHSFTQFFQAINTESLTNFYKNEACLYPESFLAFAAMNADKEAADYSERLTKWAHINAKLNEQHARFYQKRVECFIRSPIYILLSAFL